MTFQIPTIDTLHAGTHNGNVVEDSFTIDRGFSQIHIFGGDLNNYINLKYDLIDIFSQGHHVRSGDGRDTFNFTDTRNVQDTIVGRIEDFDNSRDRICVEGMELNLLNLPKNVKIVEYNGENNDVGTDPQQWLLINTGKGKIFYSLEGARVDMNGDGGSNGGIHETHFMTRAPLFSTLLEVKYVDPQNYVPSGWSPSGGIVINDTDLTKAQVLAQINGTIRGDLIAAGLNDDKVMAGGGDDMVWGGSGHDTIFGGNGHDTISGNNGKDFLDGGDGYDLLVGGYGDDFLRGGSGADRLVGGVGDDRLLGQLGADKLIGGFGGDTFLFRAFSDSKANANQRDSILDFQRGIDKIDLSWIDADRSRAGNQAFDYNGTAGFNGHDHVGDVRFNYGNDGVTVAVDIDANGTGDMWIRIEGVDALSYDDFIF